MYLVLSSVYSYWTSAIFVTGSNIQSLNTEKITWGGNTKVQNSITMDRTALTEASKKVTMGNAYTYFCVPKNSKCLSGGKLLFLH